MTASPPVPRQRRRFPRMTRDRRQMIAYRRDLQAIEAASGPLRVLDGYSVVGTHEAFGMIALDRLPRDPVRQHTLTGILTRDLIRHGFDLLTQHRAGSILVEARCADTSHQEFGTNELTVTTRVWLALLA